MKRNLQLLRRKFFDIVIIGGGAFGACAARDAAMRGLSVALVEKKDFCGGTSANSFKMIHGGIRYIQHADIVRIKQSCRERSALLRTAPHLVQPLPIVIPTYGYGKSSKMFLGAGMLLYDILTLGRNRGIKDPNRKISWSKFLDKEEVLKLFPGIEKDGLTGAAVFEDGQMYNPPRLVLSYIQSAFQHGAVVANYAEAIEFIKSGNKIEGVWVKDRLNRGVYNVRANTVLLAAGPWSESILKQSIHTPEINQGAYSRDACFVIKRRATHKYALAVQGRTHDPDAVLSRPARHLFVVPWRDYQLVGVWHVVYRRDPDQVSLQEDELSEFVDEINTCYPNFNISSEDISICNAGLVPFGENDEGDKNLSYGKRSRLIDHAREHGIQGLVTLIGIRYTTARGDAARAVNIIAKKLKKGLKRPSTASTPVYGGGISNIDKLIHEAKAENIYGLPDEVMKALVRNYGTKYGHVLKEIDNDRELGETIGNSFVLKAEILHAIRHEMAVNLDDIVFRRTDLATGFHPGNAAIALCARLAGRELGWSVDEIREQIANVENGFIKIEPSD